MITALVIAVAVLTSWLTKHDHRLSDIEHHMETGDPWTNFRNPWLKD